MTTKVALHAYGEQKTQNEKAIGEVVTAIEFVTMAWLEEQVYQKQIQAGLGKVFKSKVESTLQGRGWVNKVEILPKHLRGETGALYYDRLKEFNSETVALTWGFHHHQAIMRNLLKPIFHKIDETNHLSSPALHIVAAPSSQVISQLKMNNAQATCHNFESYLGLLSSELLVPTILISIESLEE